MLEYDFLGIINDYTGIYRDFSLPAIICDMSFKVYWSNQTAKSLYPHLTEERGLDLLLKEFDGEQLIGRLKSGGTCQIDRGLGFGGARVNLMPILYDGASVGAVAIITDAGAAEASPGISFASRTPEVLEASVRQSVEEMFSTMDNASLKADMLDAGWVKQSFDDIAQSGYHILRIAANLFQFAQYQSSPPVLDLKWLDIFEQIIETRSTLESIAKKMNIPVRYNLDDAPGFAAIDLQKFELAFFNIVNNSLYYTRPGNSIDITGVDSPDFVTITVKDRGVGIPADILTQVTRPYFSRGKNGAPSGAGLGLTIAKIILEAHGGSILIESEENEGTSVTVTLPKKSFSQKLALSQGRRTGMSDRFSGAYIGIADAALSPYLEQ